MAVLQFPGGGEEGPGRIYENLAPRETSVPAPTFPTDSPYYNIFKIFILTN